MSALPNSYHHQRFHSVNLEQFDIIRSTIYLSRNNHRANNFLLTNAWKSDASFVYIYKSVCFVLLTQVFLSSPLDILDLWIGHWPNCIMVKIHRLFAFSLISLGPPSKTSTVALQLHRRMDKAQIFLLFLFVLNSAAAIFKVCLEHRTHLSMWVMVQIAFWSIFLVLTIDRRKKLV